MAIRTIVSGGQSGVDRAALDVAIALGIPYGGWCPAGRRAEDGPIPRRYRLRATASAAYRVRTARNVACSDATLVLLHGVARGGTALTCRLAERRAKPLLVVDLSRPLRPARVRAWLATHAVRTLNVAGPRESTQPGIHAEALAYLRRVLAPNDHRRAPTSERNAAPDARSIARRRSRQSRGKPISAAMAARRSPAPP